MPSTVMPRAAKRWAYNPGPQPRSSRRDASPRCNAGMSQSTDRSMKSCRRDAGSESGSRWKRSICAEMCSSFQNSGVVYSLNASGLTVPA